MKIKIMNKSNNEIPKYETIGSAGMDLRAYLPDQDYIVLVPGRRYSIHTGLYMEIPDGYEAQIRPRSGLAMKNGITVINTPGTIDSDYRLEICVLLINLGTETFKIKNGDRIAQMIINKYEKVELYEDELSETGRGGFGSTGIE